MANEFTPNATEPRPSPLRGKPGVKRDGTDLDTDSFLAAEWARWTAFGRARKMNGYRQITDTLSGPARGLHVNPENGFTHVHVGSSNALERVDVASDGSLASGVSNRTPVGFVTSPDNRWSFDLIWDAFGAGASRILAMAPPTYSAIDASTGVKLWYGDATGTAVLTDTGAPSLSGGVCVLHPYTFVYGSDGRVAWSDAGLPATWAGGASGTARITGKKVVKGLPMRGGNDNAPAGLFWSLNALVRGVATPSGTPTFKFDTVSTSSISIISPDAVVDYDGSFYWLGEDRFYVYNGVVQELANTYNLNYVFGNLTYDARMTSYAFVVPRWGEIWFCVPLFGATVPNWAVIYNARLRVWYDTPLPEGGRSCAVAASVFPFPLQMGTVDVGGGKYQLWQHETAGFDKVVGTSSLAVRSFYTRPDVSYYSNGADDQWVGVERNVHLARFEPDFTQVGDLTVAAEYRAFTRTAPVTLTQICTPTSTRLDDLRGQGRLLRFTVESNTLGGFYEEGECVMYIRPGDVRPVGV